MAALYQYGVELVLNASTASPLTRTQATRYHDCVEHKANLDKRNEKRVVY